MCSSKSLKRSFSSITSKMYSLNTRFESFHNVSHTCTIASAVLVLTAVKTVVHFVMTMNIFANDYFMQQCSYLWNCIFLNACIAFMVDLLYANIWTKYSLMLCQYCWCNTANKDPLKTKLCFSSAWWCSASLSKMADPLTHAQLTLCSNWEQGVTQCNNTNAT